MTIVKGNGPAGRSCILSRRGALEEVDFRSAIMENVGTKSNRGKETSHRWAVQGRIKVAANALETPERINQGEEQLLSQSGIVTVF